MMNYNLYAGSDYASIWGDGAGGTGTISDGFRLGVGGAGGDYTICGRIPALQTASGGVYGDTIVVGVTY